jgi:hypothetical protein
MVWFSFENWSSDLKVQWLKLRLSLKKELEILEVRLNGLVSKCENN